MWIYQGYFRTVLLVVLFNIISTFFWVKKNTKQPLFLLVFLIIFLFTGIFLTRNYSGTYVLNRIFIQTEYDLKTINARFSFWNEAYQLGLSSPFYGIGLGNFYDKLIQKPVKSLSILDPNNLLSKVTLIDPHNIFFRIFAETGFFGLISMSLIIIFFLNSDIRSLRKRKEIITKAFIFSFWSLFLFSFIGPSFDIQYQTLFWLLRSLIIINENQLLT